MLILPRLNKNAQEETNDSALEQAVIASLPTISITTSPVWICGVNRRANLGNWEHIDIYGGLALPTPGVSIEDVEALREMVIYAAEIGFNIASQETYQRYNLIKESQKNPRA